MRRRRECRIYQDERSSRTLSPGPTLQCSARVGTHLLRFFGVGSALLGVLLGATVHSAEAVEPLALTVRAEGFRCTEGVALFALYASEESWLDIEQAALRQVVPIVGTAAEVTFQAVPPGTWGISVIHDANRNGKLDMRWLPWPKPQEGAAVSNDPQALIGPPGWDDARLSLTGNELVRVQMVY